MNKFSHAALLAAVVSAAAAFTAPVQAADDAKMEKCYGISKAGENSCASAKGGHSCAGQSKAAFSGQDFKAVPAGSCDKMMGSLTAFEGANPKIKS